MAHSVDIDRTVYKSVTALCVELPHVGIDEK